MTKKTPKTPEARQYRHNLAKKLVEERNKGNKEIAQNLLDQNMTTQEYWGHKFGEHEKISETRAEIHKNKLEFKKEKKELDDLEKKKKNMKSKIEESEKNIRNNSKEKIIENCYLDDVAEKDPSKKKLIELFKQFFEGGRIKTYDNQLLEEFYKELVENCDNEVLNGFFVKSQSDIFGYQFESDSREGLMKKYLQQLESKGWKFAYTKSFYDYWRPLNFEENYKKAMEIGKSIYENSKEAKEAKEYEENIAKVEKMEEEYKGLKSDLNTKKIIVSNIENKAWELNGIRKFYSSLTPENLESLLRYEKEYGESNLLKRLLQTDSNFDLNNFLISTPHEFIAICERLDMRPCKDGKHQIAIKLKDAPSVNTGAGLQYGMNVSVWYDGQIQETKYYKYRDGYTSMKDDRGNYFSHILDISVDDKTGEIKVIAKANNEIAKTITFQIDNTNKEYEIPQEKRVDFDKRFETTKLEILKLQTRNTSTALSYNLAYRGDVISGSDPYRQVPYEKAQVISEAIDYKRGLGAIVISTQIDASAASGKQMGYYAYIIHPNGSREEVRSDNLHASDMRNGKTVNIPDANALIKKYRNKKEKAEV